MVTKEFRWRGFLVQVVGEPKHVCGYLLVPREYSDVARSIGSTDAPVVEETPVGEDRLTFAVEYEDGTMKLGWDYGHTYCKDRTPPAEIIIREGIALAAVIVDRHAGQRRAREAFRELFGVSFE